MLGGMPELCDPCRVVSGFGTGEPVVSLRSTTGYCLASLRLCDLLPNRMNHTRLNYAMHTDSAMTPNLELP